MLYPLSYEGAIDNGKGLILRFPCGSCKELGRELHTTDAFSATIGSRQISPCNSGPWSPGSGSVPQLV